MSTIESKNFWQLLAITFFTMCFGLFMHVAKSAKKQYHENLRTYSKMYYIHGINQINKQINKVNQLNISKPIIITTK